MEWVCLVVAGLFECGWAIGLKYTEGVSKIVPLVLTIVSMGMVLFGESRDILRMICLLLILSGIVGLKLVSSSQGT